MTRFGIRHKVLSMVVMNAILFISIVGAYPVYASPHSRFLWKMRPLLHVRHFAVPVLIKTLHKNLHKKNDLGLSEQQQQQLEEEFQRFAHSAAQLHREFRISKRDLFSKKIRTGKQSGTNATDTQIHMAKLTFRALFRQHITAIFNILTPEQHKKLRHRGLAVLMLYMLGAELNTFLSRPRTEELTEMPSAHIDRTAEHVVGPDEILGDCAVYESLYLSPPENFQNQIILRI